MEYIRPRYLERFTYALILSLFFIFTGCSKADIKNEQVPVVETVMLDTTEVLALRSSSSNGSSDKKSYDKKTIKEIEGLVLLTDLDDSFIIDLKYATKDNFTGRQVYPVAVCVLQKETALKLINVNNELKEKGYVLKVLDAYRPPSVQQIFWDMIKDERFVANPAKGGSRHNRGTAVDVTVVDKDGNELKMPSAFDDFSTKAYRRNSAMDAEAKKNMDMLTAVMVKHGFTTIETEWWHYDDSSSSKYKIVDVPLESFLEN